MALPVQEVYKNSDGSGGVVGYVADFGFIDKATYDAPGFDLNAAPCTGGRSGGTRRYATTNLAACRAIMGPGTAQPPFR